MWSSSASADVIGPSTVHHRQRTGRVSTISAPGRHARFSGRPSGRRLPAKVTVVGRTDGRFLTTDTHESGRLSRQRANWRVDLVPDDLSDPSTLEYIESSHYTENGSAVRRTARAQLRHLRLPWHRIQFGYSSKRPDRCRADSCPSTIRRVVPTPGYVSADFHLHAQPSLILCPSRRSSEHPGREVEVPYTDPIS